MNNDRTPIIERQLSLRLLTTSAAAISAVLDSFGVWLLAGFGAAISLIVVNLSSIKDYIPISNIRHAILLFLVATICALLAKYLASIISAMAINSENGRQIGNDLPPNTVNFESILLEIETATFYPARWLVSSSFRKVRQGDFAASGRLTYKLAQIQGILLFAEVALCVAAAGVLAYGLAV
jgi:hypothetical protein